MIYQTLYKSPVGKYYLYASDQGLEGIYLENQKYFYKTKEQILIKDNLPVFDFIKHWLDDYFAGKRPVIDLSILSMHGTSFQNEVWSILATIPYGKTMTYGDIAKLLAKQRGIERMSAQAVGGAVGHNPFSIYIPCHRVLGSDGSLTGYAGGIEVKCTLLELEGIFPRQ